MRNIFVPLAACTLATLVLAACSPLAAPGASPGGSPGSSSTVTAKPTSSGCVTCHTDSRKLLALADPTPVPVVSAEQSGEG